MSEHNHADIADNDGEKQWQTCFVPCIYSLFVPSLGQLFQKRNTAFADGSIVFLQENINREKLEAYFTIAGGENMDEMGD